MKAIIEGLLTSLVNFVGEVWEQEVSIIIVDCDSHRSILDTIIENNELYSNRLTPLH